MNIQNGATAELFGSANIIKGNGEGIKLSGSSNVLLDAKNDIKTNFGENIVYGSKYGIWNIGGSSLTLMSKTLNYVNGGDKGIYIFNNDSKVLLNSDILNYIGSENLGIDAYNKVDVNLSAKENIIVSNADIQAQSGASVNLDAQSNKLLAGDINTQGFGSGHAIQAASASNVDLNAIDGDNSVSGVIYAKGESTKVNLTHKISEQDESKGSNIILSSAHGTEDRTDVVAAVYAQSNGEVNIIAGKDGYNYIATDTELGAGETEQTIWAQQGGKINIEGRTFIIAENSNKNTDKIEGGVDTGEEQAGNSLGIAITAGTGTITDGNGNVLEQYRAEDGSLAERKDEDRSTVKITYEGNENGLNSFVKGDIVSGYGGLINIEKNSTATGGIDIQGNALAANGGKLNIDLGNGGTWIGRADDYGDAGYGADAENHQNFYNPAFSNEILEGGTVNLKMGNNSTWYVNGQSWITSIDTSGAENATIDLVEANTDKNESAHALTIYNLKGNANINMSLDGDRTVSDMLYIKNAEGEYNIALADAVTTADMYANGLNGLRFATVGDGSKVKFNAGSYDSGLFNVEYEVGTDEYDGNTENDVYNGSDFNTEKPGTDSVDDFFDYDGADPNEGVTTLAEVAGETALDEVQGTTNYKLIARKGESISDAGNTVLNMSKANYSQAVYMDTLNKRLGEARYLEGDEGLWIRMRHDKIDKDSSYEITNNMYELGYDKKYESKDKNGYHRKGVAIDYMDGDTSYDNIAGSGETNRKGIWLYDTWIGNKGHYTDYVAKWGHLENSFDLYTKTRGEKVSGEYDNDVYSLSAEWGYKDQLNNDWYIEPQVQLQYARVTGADYETSQGTQVSVDGIDSLIARAGFRLGKDFGEEKKSTFYVKADVLHEFLGDQDITAIDKTTDGKLVSIGYDNDGTWYSVGLGFSTMLSDNSYAFLDVEKLFGNDNDNSYQINGGFNWLL